MNVLSLWLTFITAALGFFLVAAFILLRLSNPVEERVIELRLSGGNAEFLLRGALRVKPGFYVRILAVCEDGEAEKTCEIFNRIHPNILFCRLPEKTQGRV